MPEQQPQYQQPMPEQQPQYQQPQQPVQLPPYQQLPPYEQLSDVAKGVIWVINQAGNSMPAVQQG